MSETTHIVDAVEQAARERPFCPCGRHTTPVWHDGTIWLECAARLERPAGPVRRFLADLGRPYHTHEPIIDVPAAPDGEERLAA